MIIKCEEHGEVEGQPSLNNDLFCPECSKEAMKTWAERAAQRMVHTDKAKPGTEMNGLTLSDVHGNVLGSIQTITPTVEDREKLLKVGKLYELSEPRGPYSMGCAVQGHMPCRLCEPGQRAEEAEKRLEYCPSCGRLLPFGKSLLGFLDDPPFEKPARCPDCGWELKKEPPQYEQFLEGLKKADLIESYRMTGEDTAEIKMKHVVNWINKVGWSRLEPG